MKNLNSEAAPELYIAQQIVEKLGGQLRAHSNGKEQGSTFSLALKMNLIDEGFLNEPLPAYDMVQGSLADDLSIEDSLSYLEPEE